MPDSVKKVILFADQDVGYDSVKFITEQHPKSLIAVVTIGENSISGLARSSGVEQFDFNLYSKTWSIETLPEADYIILAWWPKIIKYEIINFPKIGVINFHPSFLPYNRGKNYNFWTIVEQSKFGVTLHFVDEGIDSGDIIFQKEIYKSWEDTGESLYKRAKAEMLKLFEDNFSRILSGDYHRIPQHKSAGSFHYASELEKASELNLEKIVKTEDLLNLLRARTFSGKPSCYFIEDGIKYEVRIEIKRSKS